MKKIFLELLIKIRNKLREIFPPKTIVRKIGKIILRKSKNIYQIFNILKENKLFSGRFLRLFPIFMSTPNVNQTNSNWFDYQMWIMKNEPKRNKPYKLSQEQKIKAKHILISIVVPVYQTNSKYLTQMIESVRAQTYENWELCIANASPENKKIRKIIEHFKSSEPRIQSVNIGKNLGIAGNTNKAIELVNGEYVAFLDHDDILAPFAILEVVKALNKYPRTDLIYSDEDKIDSKNRIRFNPFFKPGFSIDYLRSVNYICHLLVIRKEIGDSIGWLRDGFDGAQDYDLILRSVEKSRMITHIPKILYHWRSHKNSTAFSTDAKDYASTKGEKAIQAHLQRIGLKGKVTHAKTSTSFWITYDINIKPKVSIIIPNHDHAEDLNRCIESILSKSSYHNFEIIIAENNSREPKTFELYKKLCENRIIRVEEFNDQPFNFSKVNNQASQIAKGEMILFLNNDTEIINSDWIENMLMYAIRPEVGAVGALLLYPDNTIQHAGVIVGINRYAGHVFRKMPEKDFGYFGNSFLPHNLSAVTGACVMTPKELFFDVGGFDEIFPLACSDIDYCLKIRQKDKLIVFTPHARLYHFESKTRGYDDENEEKKDRYNKELRIFKNRWSEFLDEGDPYYNPNLTQFYLGYAINLYDTNQNPRATSSLFIPK